MINILLTILLSSVKFAMIFPVAILQFKFSFLETILWTNLGGLIGIYFFAFLSKKIIVWWNRHFRKNLKIKSPNDPGKKKTFTKRNRRIIRIKQRYGLFGIALSTPILLSIPLGTFLVVRYYKSSQTKFLYLISANLAWSIIYTAFYLFWDNLFFTS